MCVGLQYSWLVPKQDTQLGNNDFFMMCEYLTISLCLLIQCLCFVLLFVPSFSHLRGLTFMWCVILTPTIESESTKWFKKVFSGGKILECGPDNHGPKGVLKSAFV